MHKIDVAALLARIAGLGILASDASFQTSITSIAGNSAPKIIAGIGLASLLATDVLRIIGSPTSISAPTSVLTLTSKDIPTGEK